MRNRPVMERVETESKLMSHFGNYTPGGEEAAAQDTEETDEQGMAQQGVAPPSAVALNLRRAKDIFFINDQMETHGSKAFFEFRNNVKNPGIKMFVELTDRHLLVSPADDITRPIVKIHILELVIAARPDRLLSTARKARMPKATTAPAGPPAPESPPPPPFILLISREDNLKSRTIPSSCFETGRGYFCFKDASEMNEWSRRIKASITALSEMPPDNHFETGELEIIKDPEEEDTVLLHNFKSDGPLAKFNDSLAIVVAMTGDKTLVAVLPDGPLAHIHARVRNFKETQKESDKTKATKTIRVNRDNMTVLRHPMSHHERTDLQSKAMASLAALHFESFSKRPPSLRVSQAL